MIKHNKNLPNNPVRKLAQTDNIVCEICSSTRNVSSREGNILFYLGEALCFNVNKSVLCILYAYSIMVSILELNSYKENFLFEENKSL